MTPKPSPKPWREMLPIFEGRYNFLYPDNSGLPTCGEGHACETPEEAVAIFGDPRAAEDWRKIRAAQPGQALHIYEAMTVCRLTDDQIDTRSGWDRAAVEAKLARYVPDHTGWPTGVQEAMRDIVWNTGHLGFPDMLRFIRAGQWEAAAKESFRPAVQQSRNDWTRDQILSAIPE